MTAYKTQLGKSKQKIRELREELQAEEQHYARLIEKATAERFQEKQVELETKIGGLNLLVIRDALCEEFSAEDIDLADAAIALHGSGPWDNDEFFNFILEKGFTPCTTNEDHRVLVLGKGEIDEDLLAEELTWAIEQDVPLQVYSQELFVYYMISRSNPLLDLEEDKLFEVVDAHAGIQFVINYEGFDWPVNEPTTSDGVIEFDSNDLRDQSVLHKLGYNATEGRLTTEQRRRFLSRAFTEHVDHLCSDSHERRIWGSPESQQRLYAMARLLSKLISFRSGSVPNAAERWRSDLAWLRDHYYRGNMQFDWPRPRVTSAKTANKGTTQDKVMKVGPVDSVQSLLTNSWPFPSGRR